MSGKIPEGGFTFKFTGISKEDEPKTTPIGDQPTGGAGMSENMLEKAIKKVEGSFRGSFRGDSSSASPMVAKSIPPNSQRTSKAFQNAGDFLIQHAKDSMADTRQKHTLELRETPEGLILEDAKKAITNFFVNGDFSKDKSEEVKLHIIELEKVFITDKSGDDLVQGKKLFGEILSTVSEHISPALDQGQEIRTAAKRPDASPKIIKDAAKSKEMQKNLMSIASTIRDIKQRAGISE